MKCVTFGLTLVDARMIQNTWINNVSSLVRSLMAIQETARPLPMMKNVVTKIAITGPILVSVIQMTKNVASTCLHNVPILAKTSKVS